MHLFDHIIYVFGDFLAQNNVEKCCSPSLYQFNEKIFNGRVCRAQMHYHAKFRQNRSNGWGDMVIFQDGGHPPSWICGAHVGTIFYKYLEVFII